MRWLVWLLLLAGCSPPPAPAPTPPASPSYQTDVIGFEVVTFGMSREEVKAGLGWPVGPCSDQPEDWCVENYDIAGHTCRVRFRFDDRGMRQVEVTGPPEAYEAMLALQTQRYGPSQEGAWKFPTGSIRLEKGTRLRLTRN